MGSAKLEGVRIAITGGIADGKSTVCAQLEKLGHLVVSADEIVARLYSDADVVSKLKQIVGESVASNGSINRTALRAAVTNDDEVRRKVNAIFHPAVMSVIIEETASEGLAFAEVPLLIETATQGLFDEVWVVAAGVEEQRKRLASRLGNAEQADALLATQIPTEAKIAFADRVIRTNEPPETVNSKIARHVEEVIERSLRT